MNNPKYIVITPFFPDLNHFSGPFIYDQVKAISAVSDYEVIVFKPKAFYSNESDYEFEGVKVYRFNLYQLPSGILPGLFDFLSLKSFKRKLEFLNIDIDKIEIVHSHVTGNGIFSNYLKKTNKNIKTILQHHGFEVLGLTNGRFAKYKWHRNWVEKYGTEICNRIDLQVCVSKKTLTYLQAIPMIQINDSYILYNGVDTTKFFPTYVGKDSSVFTIGCIGNFWEIKDQITLIKAVQRLLEKGIKNIRLKLVGTGYLLNSCINYVSENDLGKYISFISQIKHRELNEFYNSLDLFVLPSYYEAFGCVYTEAFICGVPFIAVEKQGISELIPEEDHLKWLIRPNDVNGLAQKIESYMDHRFTQKLNTDVDIKQGIIDFLEYLKNAEE